MTKIDQIAQAFAQGVKFAENLKLAMDAAKGKDEEDGHWVTVGEGEEARPVLIKGKKKAAKEAVEKMLENCESGKDYSKKCFISNSGCREDAEYLAGLLKETFPNIKDGVQIFDIGTIIGTHTGRGTVALFFFGNKREN